MGADWYSAITIYGHIISIPIDSKFRKFLNTLKKCIPKHAFIDVLGCLTEISSRMEFEDYDYITDIEESNGFIVIGFEPTLASNFIEQTNELSLFIEKNKELFSKFTLSEPRFHSGISWDRYYDSEDDDSEDDDSEDDDSKDDDDDEDN